MKEGKGGGWCTVQVSDDRPRSRWQQWRWGPTFGRWGLAPHEQGPFWGWAGGTGPQCSPILRALLLGKWA